MSLYQLKRVQCLPLPLNECWSFFSSPRNLSQIIPRDMDFTIVSENLASEMFAGQIIRYRLRPLLGIPFFWVTEITHVEQQVYFVDEQRSGPYKLWHHAHFFKAVPGGTEMTDLVHYKIPFWLLGNLAHSLFIRKKLGNIFDYRREVLQHKFGLLSA